MLPKITRVQRFIVEGQSTNDELKISFSEWSPLQKPLHLHPLEVIYDEENQIASLSIHNMCPQLIAAGEWQPSDGLRIEMDTKEDTLTLSLLDFFSLKDEMKMTCFRNVYTIYSRSGCVAAIHIQNASTTVARTTSSDDGNDELEDGFRFLRLT